MDKRMKDYLLELLTTHREAVADGITFTKMLKGEELMLIDHITAALNEMPDLTPPTPPKVGQTVEVLGYDGEPKYTGTYTSAEAPPGCYAIFNPDTGEIHYPAQPFVRVKEATQ